MWRRVTLVLFFLACFYLTFLANLRGDDFTLYPVIGGVPLIMLWTPKRVPLIVVRVILGLIVAAAALFCVATAYFLLSSCQAEGLGLGPCGADDYGRLVFLLTLDVVGVLALRESWQPTVPNPS